MCTLFILIWFMIFVVVFKVRGSFTSMPLYDDGTCIDSGSVRLSRKSSSLDDELPYNREYRYSVRRQTDRHMMRT